MKSIRKRAISAPRQASSPDYHHVWVKKRCDDLMAAITTRKAAGETEDSMRELYAALSRAMAMDQWL